MTPHLGHPGPLVLDPGVEEHDGKGEEKVEEQPDVDEGHLGRSKVILMLFHYDLGGGSSEAL